jgi:hypothetical protein
VFFFWPFQPKLNCLKLANADRQCDFVFRQVAIRNVRFTISNLSPGPPPPYGVNTKFCDRKLRGFRRYSRIADSNSAKAAGFSSALWVMTSSQRFQEVRAIRGAVAHQTGVTLLAMRSFSRSHDPVIRVYDEAGDMMETHQHKVVSKSGNARQL